MFYSKLLLEQHFLIPESQTLYLVFPIRWTNLEPHTLKLDTSQRDESQNGEIRIVLLPSVVSD